jgi:hypothetical protein
MQTTPNSGRPRAALARDAARLRLRRVTQLSVAAMIAVAGAFAALAAGSTHAKKAVVRTAVRTSRATILAVAPAPPLVAAQSAAAAQAQSEAPAQAAPAPAPAAPAVAPTPSYSPPVVVSGGS